MFAGRKHPVNQLVLGSTSVPRGKAHSCQPVGAAWRPDGQAVPFSGITFPWGFPELSRGAMVSRHSPASMCAYTIFPGLREKRSDPRLSTSLLVQISLKIAADNSRNDVSFFQIALFNILEEHEEG